MKLIITAITLVILYNFSPEVSGHGALHEPPSRNSAFRFGFNTPTDYNDMSHNCGTFEHTYVKGKAFCPACGDPAAECPGGSYCKNVIVRNYKAGETIKATIKFSGNHGGVISFRLCPSDNGAATWDCFVMHELAITEAGGKTNWQEPWSDAEHHDGNVDLHVKLPAGFTCKRCVFQWHWSGANYMGTCSNGTTGMGCGPQQTYIACADISIS